MEICVVPRHVDAAQAAWERGRGMPDFLFASLLPVQQTTSGIGHHVK